MNRNNAESKDLNQDEIPMENKCKCSRRKFIISSTKAALGAAVCGNLLHSCNKKPVEILGDDESKLVTLDLNDYPALSKPGGAEKKFLDEENVELIIYRKSETEAIVVSVYCTHQGVPVDLPDDDGIIRCPHDGARFDIKQGGKALSPELTTQDLKRYNCTLTGTILTIYQN